MAESSKPSETDAALIQAMAENQLDLVWLGTVRDLLRREDLLWRRCCGSNCEPCTLTLARVVDRARELGATDSSE